MIHDFLKKTDSIGKECDVCIVGGGAIGISLAREFINSSYSVVLLEGGGSSAEKETQELYRTENTGLPHNNYSGRIRIFGGTTTKWAGQASPLDEIDFKYRSWVPNSGWPIELSDIKPYFSRVEKIMGIGHRAYSEDDWPRPNDLLPSFDRNQFRLVYSQFSPHANFSLAFRENLIEAKNIQVLLHANVVHLQLNSQGDQLDHVVYKSLSGKKGELSAKYFILCCGGIEAARLLLASRDIAKKGVGNEKDLVGRYFHDHIHMHAARINVSDHKRLKLLQTFYEKGLRYCPKIAIQPNVQEDEKILNIAGDIYFKNNPNSPVQTAKDIVKFAKRDSLLNFPGGIGSALLRVILGAPKILKVIYQYIFNNQVMVDDGGPLYLGIQCEQAPNPESRILLSDEKDSLGLPKAVVQWKLSDLDKKTIETFISKIGAEFKRSGLAELDLDTIPYLEDSEFPLDVFDSHHHMGTTRMSETPSEGVVDKDCKVFGVRNLFISSTSVLPTGGYSNPTFNALALGLRASDQIKGLIDQQDRSGS